MDQYLTPSTYIDFDHPDVLAKASELKADLVSDTDIARSCFEFVRDHIRHSWDYQIDQITCRASDVLKLSTGYCYSQSHLLAALLRANGIPAGLVYQRLSIDEQGAPYCLHGLNAVYLKDFGWYRIDARGNKPGIEADFCPPIEKLAFATNGRLEKDIDGIWAEPMSEVVEVLLTYKTCLAVYENLPDLHR